MPEQSWIINKIHPKKHIKDTWRGLPFLSICEWVADYEWGRDSIEDDPRSGRQKISTTNEQVDALHHGVLDYRCLTVQQLVKPIGIRRNQNGLHCFNWDLGDEQAVCKMGPKNTEARRQTEKGWHFLNTSDSLPD